MDIVSRNIQFWAILAFWSTFAKGTQIDSVSPRYGSLCGETRLTIRGAGFSLDNINEGNQVQLVSSTTSYDCPVLKDGTTEVIIMCYTKPGMKEDLYYVRVTVDGVKVPENKHCRSATSWNCRLYIRSHNTPTIQSVEPMSGPPGSIIQINGRLFTERYDTNVEKSTNGKTNRIARVYAGGQNCDLKGPNDFFYGKQLNNGGSSQWGYMKCKMNGKFIGNNNASFIISGEYGRSCRSSALAVSRNLQLYQFQTFAEISSVSPSMGSIHGSTITIHGRYFDDRETRSPTKVMISGTKCDVISVTSTQIIFKTPKQPEMMNNTFPGNRGLLTEIWNKTRKHRSNLKDVLNLDDTQVDYSRLYIDQSYFTEDVYENYVTRTTGYFVPPWTGEYSFSIKADDGGLLYMSNNSDPQSIVQLCEAREYITTYTKYAEQSSPKLNLTAGEAYYMVILHRDYTIKSYVKVAARYYQTTLTNQSTAFAEQEHQKIQIRSTVVREVQNVSLNRASLQNSVNEVQEVEVVENSGSLSTASFRLGLYNAFTEKLTTASTKTQISKAVTSLPFFHADETVNVNVSRSSDRVVISIEFISGRGDFKDIMVKTAMGENGETLNATVIERIKGVASGQHFAIEIAGVISPLFSGEPTATEVESGINTMFGTRCPRKLAKPLSKKFHYNFEGGNKPNNVKGDIVTDMEAFCGKGIFKNPNFLFNEPNGFSLGVGEKTICFAYFGKLQNFFKLKYAYRNDEGQTVYNQYAYGKVVFDSNPGWHYTCINMLDIIKSARSSAAYTLYFAEVRRDGDNYFVDEIYVGRDPTINDIDNINSQRMLPAKLNGYMIDHVNVQKFNASNTPVYEVTIIPFNCGNNFPLFSGVTGQIGAGSSISVHRPVQASPPVTGNFTLSFKGNSRLGIPYSVSGQELTEILQTSLPEMGSVYAYRHGDCAVFDLHIGFHSKGGDQDTIQVSSQLNGEGVTAETVTVTDGALWLDPIPGDMLLTPEKNPQVMAYINDIPTKCVGDCSFDWSIQATPTVISVTPTTGVPMTTIITISGQQFSNNETSNRVTIGGTPCDIITSSETQIECRIQNGSAGTFPVRVMVDRFGLAENTNDSVVFTYQFQISSISPTSVSLGGGLDLQLSGYGFSVMDKVYVGGSLCSIVNASSSNILCRIPPSNVAGTVSVTVQQGQTGNNITHGTQISYSTTNMAVITSVEPNSTYVAGGTVMTLTGNNFDPSGSLMIGMVDVPLQSISSVQAKAALPSMPAGVYPIKLLNSVGYAVDSLNNIPNVETRLIVTNISPLQGSVRGGTKLTIDGEGFSSNNTLNKVMVGQYACPVEDSSNRKIICEIEDTGKVHVVDNSGIHPQFRLSGYAWNPKYITISAGDIVEWRWSFASYITAMMPRVVQVEDEVSTKEVEGGFNSGEKSASGIYQHRFTVPGKYCYWSDYIDVYQTTWFRGCVEVQNLNSSIGEISVKVNDFEAEYFTNIPQSPANAENSGSCAGDSTPVPQCQDPRPSPTNSKKFTFVFWTCMTPTIQDISLSNGTTFDTIHISGSGFSTNNCQNEVLFGDSVCKVFNSTQTTLSCNIDPMTSPKIGVLQPVSMRHNNLGKALVTISGVLSRSFALIPAFSKVSPVVGSTQGSTYVDFMGSGFTDSPSHVTVDFGGYSCTVISVNYTMIQCKSPGGLQGQQNIKINIRSSLGQWIPALCTKDCNFNYSPALTPKLTSVSPNSVDGRTNTTLTIGAITTREGNTTDPSGITITIGGEKCLVSGVTNDTFQCELVNLPVGSGNKIEVYVSPCGAAEGNLMVTGEAIIHSVSPRTGSIHGGTLLTISGNGFFSGNTQVLIDNKDCTVQSVSLSELSCISPSHTAADVKILVTSNQVQYPQQSFLYSLSVSPAITTISPTQGSHGDTLTLSGSHFESTALKNNVTVGGVKCSVVSATANQITCVLGAKQVGNYPVIVNVEEKGLSNSNIMFEYQLVLSSVSPTSGSQAGDQTVTLSGSGFDMYTTAWICGKPCMPLPAENQTASKFLCKTQGTGSQSANTVCDVNVTTNGVSKILSNAYTYTASKTPDITAVTPSRGGTAGGTTVTITGTGYSLASSVSDISVTIAGSICDVISFSATTVVCTTRQHGKSEKALVRVELFDYGKAIQINAEFFYIDLWSSPFTWGGGPLPKEDDFVVITKGQTILLDVDTPKLKLLLIKGGSLIFDEKNLQLRAENILVVEDGLFQIGTESEPFQHHAEILLFGHHRTKEYPIYGTKSLAVRQGRLELHGKPVDKTWTKLGMTAIAGSNTIVLSEEVPWQSGNKVVIATTSHRHSQVETEMRTIGSVEADRKTIRLTEPLKYEHLGVTETFDGTTVDFRAEVGMVSRNIIVRGYSNPEWTEKIEACPDGFDTGEFAVQTCFQGRFGEEMGSDQFGAQIMIHAPEPNKNIAQARIEYVEITHAGQAFRLGRYPVHFHLNGVMSGSYVKGCGIYNTFNRAVNIHGSHNIMVEQNVIYNVMGGAMFFEDGIEMGNTMQYNLALFVRESSSLQNDDITPAAFWVTNPNNTIQHNHAAGGTHFGFWYRMHAHPDGPSFDSSVCPQHIPVAVFRNNTAHSNGWFGLWIFTTIKSRVDGGCNSKTPYMSVFETLTAWNNDKGAEIVLGGSFMLKDFVLVNNRLAGYEGKMITEGEQILKDLLIVGHASSLTKEQQGCTRTAIVLPYGYGMTVNGARFVNFNESSCSGFDFARITGTCSVNCGGFYYQTQNLKWVSSPNKGKYPWPWAGIIKDLDGTLIGEMGDSASISAAIGKSVITASDTLPPTCVPFSKFSVGAVEARVCPPDVKFHRFSFNGVSPNALNYKDFIVKNQYGNSSQPWRKKAITHKKGWLTILVDGQEYFYYFKDAMQLTNISFNGRFDRFKERTPGSYDYVVMRQKISIRPDKFMVDGSHNINVSRTTFNPAQSVHGQWEYIKADKEIRYVVSAKKSSSRRKRSADFQDNLSVRFKAYKCYYDGCVPPVDPNTVAPILERPLDFEYWSDKETWKNADYGWGGNLGNGSYDLPKDGDNVKINKDQWIVADTGLPQMGTLVLYGGLELDDANGTRSFVLNCTYIIILGGRLIIGWPNKPFLGQALVMLQGTHDTPSYPISSGPPLGSKVIGVYGGLDLHGKDVGTSWTSLAETAQAGSNQIKLASPVEWKMGDDIVIAPTGFSVWETEYFRITAVSISQKLLTLNDTLKFKHIAHTETADGQDMTMAAEVGLLTRNIRVEGSSYDKLYKQSFGARIMVSQILENGTLFIGFARLSNVEFYHSGQEGWVESYDSRSSVAFINAGKVSNIKPSYVRKCAFHKGFSPAVTVYGTNNLPVESNVIADTVWFAIESESDNTQLRHNFVTKTQWEGSYQDRVETTNVRYNGAFNLPKATNVVLEYNHVGGAERVGFQVTGEPCDATAVNPWMGNVAHTALIGVGIMPLTALKGPLVQCALLSNFTSWKNLDYGFYINNVASSSITNAKAADNGVGVFQFVAGPSATSHQYADKYANVKNSLIIGATAELDCSAALGDSSDDNIRISRGSTASPFGSIRVGITMPTFSSGGNKCPEKPCANIKAYQAIKGLFNLEDLTFAKFTNKCNNRADLAVAPNAANDDGNHPFQTQRITFVDVPDDNKLKYWRSSIGKINSADCVDMPCDAKVKCLLEDLDGTFLNSTGFVIPQSEYEWNGDKRMGLGDYRIPKEMLTRLNGSRIPVNEIAPHKGIIRSNSCTYKSAWQAYECHDLNYKTLTIESMDADTETRRLSPVAILGDGYIDLINGPQDHGWCAGYTCRKRLSTFQAIVASEKHFLMHYTSTSPQKSRFFLLNAKPDECITLSVWYSQPWRLDVYHDGNFVMPANARFAGPDKRYVIDPPPIGQPDYYKPNATGCQHDSGKSYFDRDSGILTFMIKGSDPVEVITVKTVIVSFQLPAMPVDEFYGENIVMNLASFLDIDASRVRITNIVRETTPSRRRKRDVERITGVEIEISNPPSQDLNSTSTNANDLSSDQLKNISTKIVNEVQLGNFSSVVNISADIKVAISEPPPDPSDKEWSDVSVDDDRYVVIAEPDTMKFTESPVPLHEGVPFQTQPKLQVLDTNGVVVIKLGSNSEPWEVTARLRNGTGHVDAQLLGNVSVKFSNGWANFSNLLITHKGDGYILDFAITYPTQGANFALSTSAFSVAQRPIKVVLVNQTDLMMENSLVEISLELQDNVTSQALDQIAWRSHTWSVSAELRMREMYTGTLEGITSTNFNETTGRAKLNTLNFTSSGMYVLRFTIVSNPAEYTLTFEKLINVRSQLSLSIVVEETQEISLKFDADYETIVGTQYNKYFAAMMGTYLTKMYPNLILNTIIVSKGSILVTFQIAGSANNVNATIYTLCDSVQNSTAFTFNGNSFTLSSYLMVGGNTFYGVHCAVVSGNDGDSGSTFSLAIILVAAILGTTLLIIIISLIFWRLSVIPKTKTHCIQTAEYCRSDGDIDMIMFKDKLYDVDPYDYKPSPPISTAYSTFKEPSPPYRETASPFTQQKVPLE